MIHPPQLTQERVAHLVESSMRRGRRKLAFRRFGSGIAALAIVGSLGVGAASLFNRPMTSTAPGAPVPSATGVATDQSPASTPPSEQPHDDDLPPDRAGTDQSGFEALLKDLLPTATVYVADPAVTGSAYEADLDLPTADGAVSGQLRITTTSLSPACSFPGTVVLHSDPTVCYADWEAADGKVGQHEWLLQRTDGVVLQLELSTVTRSGIDEKVITSTSDSLPMTPEEAATVLADPAWQPFLAEVAG